MEQVKWQGQLLVWEKLPHRAAENDKSEYLTEIHNDALVNLLPQVGSEYLNERDLQRGNLTVHEYTSQVELHLEAYINLQQ